jgi:anti-sigma regulatory factor (Ser/Thr protein kinase)
MSPHLVWPEHERGKLGSVGVVVDRHTGVKDGYALPAPPTDAPVVDFQVSSLRRVRRLVGEHGTQAGLSDGRVADLQLAVNEVATNSLLYGGGEGTVRVWRQDGWILCEVRDRGRIEDPLAGRRRPAPMTVGGYGLWIANQLCELVQLRTSSEGSIVRLHMRLPVHSG